MTFAGVSGSFTIILGVANRLIIYYSLLNVPATRSISSAVRAIEEGNHSPRGAMPEDTLKSPLMFLYCA